MQKKILLAVATSVLVVLSMGCGKHTADASLQPPEQIFNAVQFCQDFAAAPPEVKTLADKAWMSIQADTLRDALKYLGKLETNPALNAAQKKSVADLTGQVEKQMAKEAAAK